MHLGEDALFSEKLSRAGAKMEKPLALCHRPFERFITHNRNSVEDINYIPKQVLLALGQFQFLLAIFRFCDILGVMETQLLCFATTTITLKIAGCDFFF